MVTDFRMGVPLVLIVDDDPVCRLFCARVLETQGYRSLEAIDGRSAVQVALRERPQLILADLRLPDMSGIEAISRIIRLWPEAQGKSRFIGLSGDDSARARREMLAAGFSLVLSKPVEAEALLTGIQEVSMELNVDTAAPYRGCHPGGSNPVLHVRQDDAIPLKLVFCAELDCQLPELDRLFTALDWPAVKNILHRLTGAAALAGFPDFATRGRQLLQILGSPMKNDVLADAYLEFLRQAADLRAENRSKAD